MQDTLERAFEEMMTPRFGPVWIDIPFDVQSSTLLRREWRVPRIEKPSVNSSEICKIVDALAHSKRPLILCGHGVRLSRADSHFQQVIRRLQVPVSASWSAIDVVNSDYGIFVGRWGLYGQRAANFIVQSADLLVVFGSRLAIPQVGYDFSQFAREAKIIVVDIEPCKHPVYLQIVGDCKDVLEGLLNQRLSSWTDTSGWLAHCRGLLDKYPTVEKAHEVDKHVNSYQFIQELSKHLSSDHIVVTDMGTALLSGHQAIQLKQKQKMFTSLGLGEMGYGLPGALGAAFACPDKEVLCLNCDGGIMMNIQELHTIIEHGLNVKIVIFNNDGYLMIKHTQKMLFKGRYVQVDKKTGVGLPDFSKVLPAFGYKYFKATGLDDRNRSVIRDFLADAQPSVLEVFMDAEQPFVPKVKGIALPDGKIKPAPLEDMYPLIPIDALQKALLVRCTKSSADAIRCD